MNRKIALTLVSIAIFSNLALAQGIGSPGFKTGDDGTATQEIELNRGWNNIAINVDGATLSEAASEGTCNFEGSGYEVGPYESFAFRTDDSDNEFAPVSLDEQLDPTIGYTVGVLESCSLVFSGDEALSHSNERTLHGDQWNLITLPEDFSPNDLKNIVEDYEGSELATYEGEHFHVHEGQDNGQEVWTYPSDSLANYKSVWVGVLGDSITVDFASESIGTPGPGSDPSDGSDDSDQETTAESGDLYFWSTEAQEALVNNEAGSNNDAANYRYDMHEGSIEGVFTSHGSGERTVIVEGVDGTTSNTGSGTYVSVPADGGTTWGVDQNGAFKLAEGVSTIMSVSVEDANTGEEIGSAAFTFDPYGREDESDDSDDREIELNSGTGEYQARDVGSKTGGALSIESASYSNNQISVAGRIHTKAQFGLYVDDDNPTVKLLVNGEEVDSQSFCQKMRANAYGALDPKHDFSLSHSTSLNDGDTVTVEVDHHFDRQEIGSSCSEGKVTSRFSYSYDLTG